MMKRISRLLIIAVSIVSLSGCVWWGEGGFGLRETPEGLYQQGYENYQDGDYSDAIEFFQRLREEYPLSRYASMAEIGIADSYYSKKEYASAEMEYSNFIDFHPTDENVPYAMYQFGMCHYKSLLDVDRDQAQTHRAKEAFERLIAIFPNSKFSFMAERRLREVKQRLAEHEFYVGHFYYRNEQYRAALKRFEKISDEYAGLGLDYKVGYFLHQTRRQLEMQGESGPEERVTQRESSFMREEDVW